MQKILPALLPARHLRILEIGCGSGSLTSLLAESGYSGEYIGVDMMDRFRNTPQSEFERQFVLADAHRFEPEGQFDLIVSVSALEHIPEDVQLIQRLSRLVAPSGLQLHFVPSGWGLLVYLWHGYRQYTAESLGTRFEPRQTTLFALGGAATFLLHFLFITIGEILLRLRLRQRMPGLYRYLLDGCLQLDRWLPVCATMYAVCEVSGPITESVHG